MLASRAACRPSSQVGAAKARSVRCRCRPFVAGTDYASQCSAAGFPLEPTPAPLPTTMATPTYTPPVRGAAVTAPLDINVNALFGACEAACTGPCDIDDSMRCECSQEYFDSLYSCYGCSDVINGKREDDPGLGILSSGCTPPAQAPQKAMLSLCYD